MHERGEHYARTASYQPAPGRVRGCLLPAPFLKDYQEAPIHLTQPRALVRRSGHLYAAPQMPAPIF
jgi:hypothetical protein